MSTPSLHEGACSCLTEIVVKRMDAAAKLEHLARLQMVSLLSQAHSSGVELSVGFSSLVSALVLEILESWDKLRSRTPLTPEVTNQANQASEQLRGVMPLLLSCLSSEDIEVGSHCTATLHSHLLPLPPPSLPTLLCRAAGFPVHDGLFAFLRRTFA